MRVGKFLRVVDKASPTSVKSAMRSARYPRPRCTRSGRAAPLGTLAPVLSTASARRARDLVDGGHEFLHGFAHIMHWRLCDANVRRWLLRLRLCRFAVAVRRWALVMRLMLCTI